MVRLAIILIFSSIGGNFLIHYLKNFLLREKLKFRPDFDGWLERPGITFVLLQAQPFWILIPLIIALKWGYRLLLLGIIPGIIKREEPGAVAQKVLLKGELAFDLILSPALAILIGTILK